MAAVTLALVFFQQPFLCPARQMNPSLHDFPKSGCLMSFWMPGRSLSVASDAGLGVGNRRDHVLQRSRRAVKLVVTHLPPKHFSNSRQPVFHDRESDQSPDRQRSGLIDDIFSVSSDACSVPSGWSSGCVVGSRWNATPSDWCETFRPLSQGPKREAAQPSFQT